jgi:hypothetical protein
MGTFVEGPGPTAARVNFVTPTNATFFDAIQFDPKGPTGATGGAWSLTGQNFRMDIKRRREDPNPLVTLLSSAGQIVVDDPVQRVIHFNVPETQWATLPPGRYVYDFIMFDNSNPPVRVPLMFGEFWLKLGVSGG